VVFYYYVMKEERGNLGLVVAVALAVLNLVVWYQIFFMRPNAEAEVYFLDVGQGDSILVKFPGNVKILTDAGYGSRVVGELEGVMDDKYVDLAVITHPQADHFGGFNYLLDRYKFGAFVVTGRGSESEEWEELVEKIDEKEIPVLILSAGDRISQAGNTVEFLSPTPAIVQSEELNDTSFVNLVDFEKFKMLLTGDTGFSIENFLMKNFSDISVDVLKVGHHGSKYSTSVEFLERANPLVAVIGVGKNRFGHPTAEVLERLQGSEVFRTDEDGTVKVTIRGSRLQVYTEK
jgi:competence protein ComEC